MTIFRPRVPLVDQHTILKLTSGINKTRLLKYELTTIRSRIEQEQQNVQDELHQIFLGLIKRNHTQVEIPFHHFDFIVSIGTKSGLISPEAEVNTETQKTWHLIIIREPQFNNIDPAKTSAFETPVIQVHTFEQQIQANLSTRWISPKEPDVLLAKDPNVQLMYNQGL